MNGQFLSRLKSRVSLPDIMKGSNKKEFSGSRDEVIAQGYEPCKKCNP